MLYITPQEIITESLYHRLPSPISLTLHPPLTATNLFSVSMSSDAAHQCDHTVFVFLCVPYSRRMTSPKSLHVVTDDNISFSLMV